MFSGPDHSRRTSNPLEEIKLEPYETRILSIPVTFDQSGSYSLQAVRFRFHRFFPYEQTLARKGRRLHATKQQRIQPTYAEDTTLTVMVEVSRPMMTANFQYPSRPLYVGEEVPITLHVRNAGRIPFGGIQMFSNDVNSLFLQSGK